MFFQAITLLDSADSARISQKRLPSLLNYALALKVFRS